MEDKKQEAIEKAYSKLGMPVPEFSDENGWTGVSIFQLANVSEILYETKTDGKTCIARPISLKGLENNNGWISINSEDDLPKENGNYWVIGFGLDHPIIEYYFKEEKHTWLKVVTHYQPVIEPSKPIY
jgi:hypothetical protein